MYINMVWCTARGPKNTDLQEHRHEINRSYGTELFGFTDISENTDRFMKYAVVALTELRNF